jgi:hypothetical protein
VARRAQITEFKLEGDSDIHLVLFDQSAYLIAEMPAAQCLPQKTRDRKAIIAADEVRDKLRSAGEQVAAARSGRLDQRRRLLRHPAHAEAARRQLRGAPSRHRDQVHLRLRRVRAWHA